MPVIAGMGGNAGTQALAVTVRRLALGLIAPHHFVRVIGKEVLVGITNGLCIGVIVGAVAALLGEGPGLGAVVFLAMTGNLLVAGFAGAFIPIVLERFGVDPAQAAFFEDTVRNLPPARAIGMTTVLVGPHALDAETPFADHRAAALGPFLATARLAGDPQ